MFSNIALQIIIDIDNIDGCLDHLFLYMYMSLDCNCICIVDCRMQIAWAAGHTFAAPICKKNVSCKPTKEITHANVPYERIPQGKIDYIYPQETICSKTLPKGCKMNMPSGRCPTPTPRLVGRLDGLLVHTGKVNSD